MIIPFLAGTECAIGKVRFDNVVQIDSGVVNKSEALNAGPTVIGPDGVLIKSEASPIGGSTYFIEPGKVYVIPKESVHKTPDNLPNGRMFFQLDVFS